MEAASKSGPGPRGIQRGKPRGTRVHAAPSPSVGVDSWAIMKVKT